ncbi:MAG: type II secretion system protein [Phycisphaerae bacterium]|nr:type II secretion system protein [Phycisphaerae bacterium]
MKTRNTRSAFTLVEMVMVIVIIGLLAVVALPKFGQIRTEAQSAAETGTVSAVRSGIQLAHMTSLAQGKDEYPATLDSAAAGQGSEKNILFTNVIEDGITDHNWVKVDATAYKYAPTGGTYKYDKKTGKFTKK